MSQPRMATVKLEVSEFDLECLRWVMNNFPRNMDSATIATVATASQLVAEIDQAWLDGLREADKKKHK